ncbi:MAG: hypothetical protein JNL05_09980 [Flavobacteriales bacterium]|nr:hypothetical protein [Flavobacteriales bacterium]
MKGLLYGCMLLAFGTGTAQGQSLDQRVIAAWGGASTGPGVVLEHTVGEPMVGTLEGGGVRLTQGFHQADPVRLRLNLRAFLQGPYNSGTGRMSDSLRTRGLVPLTEPYSAIGLAGGGEQTSLSVLAVSGADAVVDWVHVELRDAGTSGAVVAARNGLLKADGDVVATDGTSPLAFTAPPGSYRVRVLHRNHLAVQTLQAVSLSSTPLALDLANGTVPLHGTEAQATVGAVQALWQGDVNGDGLVKYTGGTNDRDPILQAIGGVVPTSTTTGYANTDVNLDGTTKYTGAANDRDPVLQTIGGVIPTNTRSAQLP